MAIIVVRGPLYVRGSLQKGKWRGAQIEFQQPITLQNTCAFQSSAFQSQVSGIELGFQACGAAFVPVSITPLLHQLTDIRPSRAVKLGRGAQQEFKQPTPLAILNNQDTAGAASGDAIASGSLDAFADFAGAASGDAIASAEGTSNVFAFPTWEELLQRRGPNRAVKLGRGAQVEFKQPTPLAILNNQSGDGAASGDAIASGDLNALGDFAGAASGDAIASGSLDAFGNFAGSASGDAIASGSLDAFADFAGSASGDAIASAADGSTFFPFSVWEELEARRGPSRAVKLGRGSQFEVLSVPLPLTIPVVSSDGAGSASGDAIASGELDALADFAGAATGDAIASASGEAVIDITGTAAGDAICQGFIEDATPPVVVTPPAEGGAATGVGTRAWASWYKSTQRKKRKKPLYVEAAVAAKEEADDRLVALMAEKRVLLAQISELEFARYRAAAQADIKRAEAELALARELEDEDEAIVWLMAA